MPITEPITESQKMRLHRSIEFSRRRMADFRENRRVAIQQYVGSHYSDNGAPKHVPINKIEQTVDIFVRQLVARNPKAQVFTKSSRLKPFAEDLKLAINHLIEEIKLEDSLVEVVVDGLFLVGIIRTGINFSQQFEVRGVTHDVGQPFADVVSFDNFVVDMTATRWEDAQFQGDRFKIPLSLARKLYPEHAEHLRATGGDRVDNDGSDQVDDLSGSERMNEDHEFDPRIELTNVYLPQHNKVIVISEHMQRLPVLDEFEWNGLETGPYHRLSFSKVPQQLLPLSPLANLMEIHLNINSMARKFLRQAERQKTIAISASGDSGDAKIFQAASDGDYVVVENPSGATQLSTGGIDPRNFAFEVWLQDVYSAQAGNLDALGGLGPQADTLGQEQLINSTSSKKVDSMEYRVNRMVQEVLKALAFFLFDDPLIDLPLVKRSGGIDIPTRFSQFQMEGDFFEYNVNIEPLSMRPKSAQQQLGGLMQVLQQFVIPMMPMLQQEGKALDFERTLEIMAELGDIPQLREVIVDAQGEYLGGEVHDVGERLLQSPVTTRNTIRTNRPGATQAGKSEALIQSLLGSAQPDTAAAITRPVG